jgi:hypothetical protein
MIQRANQCKQVQMIGKTGGDVTVMKIIKAVRSA